MRVQCLALTSFLVLTLARRAQRGGRKEVRSNDPGSLVHEASPLDSLKSLAALLYFEPMPAFRAFTPVAPGRPQPQMAAKYVDSNGEEIKSAKNAYMHFAGDMRPSVTDELKKKEGAAFKVPMVLTRIGALWKEADEATKARYQKVAAEDKARFEAAVASNPANANVAKTVKKPAAKGKPRAKSSYMHFCNERRESLAAELKKSLGEKFEYKMVMSKLGEEWGAMAAGVKKKYEAMSAEEKKALEASR